MGVSVEIWRARIGCFSPNHSFKSKSSCKPTDNIIGGYFLNLALLTFVFGLLILCGDVETNPGPPLNSDIVDCFYSNGRDACVKIITSAIVQLGQPLPTEKAMVMAIQKCMKLYSSKKKNIHRSSGKLSLDMFLNSNFPLPKQGKSFEKPLNAGHDAPPEVFRCVASEMANELSSTQIKLEETEHQNKKLHEEISSLKSQLNEKSLKIRRLDTLSSECLMLKSENKKLSKASVQTNHILVEKKINLKRAIAREQYYREKVSRLEIKLPFTRNEQIVPDESFEVRNDTTIDHEEQIINLLDENENLKQEIRILQNEINELQADLSDKIITCDENGKFSSDMQQCVYSLLQHHVSSTHVSSVISAVLKLAGKTASRLPSVSTVNNMNVQRLVLAQKQLGESIKKTDDTCLYTDETSKFGNKYGGYHLSDQNGNMYVLGLRLLPTKSSSDTLSVFHEILDDIDLACNTTTNEKSLSVFTSIKATMSDRAATEIKFNSLLESYRKSILPLTLDNYSYFSESEKLSVDRLYNFFLWTASSNPFCRNSKCKHERS